MIHKRYHIVIVGAGESGVGAALLAKEKGLSCFLTDSGEIREAYRTELTENVVPFEEGRHSFELLEATNEVVKSPGVPDDSEFILKAKEKGINIISEIEFGYRYYSGKIIGITGSNGKTTTTSLIYQILKRQGENVCLAGNIGWSFCRVVKDNICTTVVLELSSFQLDGIQEFKPDIAILLNISPDHLDRYEHDIRKYIASKFRIIMNQTKEDHFIYFDHDDHIEEFIGENGLEVHASTFNKNTLKGVIDETKLKIKGPHNWLNATAAFLACKEYGIQEEAILEEMYDFLPIKHRLQKVLEINGVEYINDSKATNVDSTKFGLESFDKPIVWIVGGVDKGNDYSYLENSISGVKALVCLGKDNEKLKKFFGAKVEVMEEADSMEKAVRKAGEIAKSGDVVLLSPACASFDLFKNYEDRGNQFIQEVKKMKGEE